MWKAPAVLALVLQMAAFVIALIVSAVVDLALGIRTGPAFVAFCQGALAAALTYWRRLAPWWRPIQFCFPVAVLLLQSARLPPLIFLFLFLFSLVLYWSTFRTQVPYFPSNLKVWRLVAELLPKNRPARMIDIGCGFGGLVMFLADSRPDCEATGIELAPLPFAVSRLRAFVKGSRGRFLYGDYTDLSFADYDLVFAYLSPAAMPALWEKAHTEMRAGSLLLSYEFTIPGHEPISVLRPSPSGPSLYIWRF